MKISICIPQYNRADILIQSLQQIRNQTYSNLEIVISDDGSTDDTAEKVQALIQDYPFPIVFHRNDINLGFDRNYRKSIELASGEYCVMLGNDDTVANERCIEFLVDFLIVNNKPDIGYCNYYDYSRPGRIVEKTLKSGIIGNGSDVAVRFYNGFSFIVGIIYRKAAFDIINSDKHDGSIYGQIYLGTLMIARGASLFTIKEPLFLAGIADAKGSEANSYKETLPRGWKEYRKMDGGLMNVGHVVFSAIEDSKLGIDRSIGYKIFKRIYAINLPYWVIQYKHFGSFPAAIGLIHGMFPTNSSSWRKIWWGDKIKLSFIYMLTSSISLLFPKIIFDHMEMILRKLIRKG